MKRPFPTLLSLVLHAGLLAAVLFFTRTATVTRPIPRQTIARIALLGGSHPVPFRLPVMQTAARHPDPVRHMEATQKSLLHTAPAHPQPKAGGGAPVVANAGKGSGTAPAGSGSDAEDMVPAFPIFSPRPPVTDRSLLPSSEQKVVVDVNVDALGAVVGENLVKGIGNDLDRMVLDIVKTWRFQPATVNGKPVPTEAELIFPFSPKYPITPS